MITLYSDSVKGQWSYVALGFQQLWTSCAHVGGDDGDDDDDDDGDNDNAVPIQCEGPVEPCGTGQSSVVGFLRSCWW